MEIIEIKSGRRVVLPMVYDSICKGISFLPKQGQEFFYYSFQIVHFYVFRTIPGDLPQGDVILVTDIGGVYKFSFDGKWKQPEYVPPEVFIY